MSAENDVRSASKQFYTAINKMVNGNAAPLAEVWLHGPTVTAMHPIGGRQVGWEAVKSSFEQVAGMAEDGRVELKDQVVQVVGDMAYEAGVEKGTFKLAGKPVAIEQRVTNIYQRHGGAWKIVHHHTDISKAMLDVLNKAAPQPAHARK